MTTASTIVRGVATANWFRGLTGALFVMLCGCAHEALVVKTSATSELPGIPFYLKKGICNKESAWLEPQYTVMLAVSVDGGPPITHSIVLSRHGYEGATTKSLLQTIQGLKTEYELSQIIPDACPAAIGQLWDAVAADPSFKVVPDLDSGGKLLDAEHSGNALLVANTASSGTAVDYETRYYLNAESPWIGSTQVDAKLAADGTLTEGVVKRDDETFNTILTTIGALVGDFTGAATATAAAASAPATGAAVRSAIAGREPACPASPGWPAPRRVVKYVYSLKTVIYRHDHKVQSADLGAACTLGDQRVLAGNFTVSVDDGSDKAAKKSAKAIEFSGQVKLPESADAKKDEAKK